MSEADYLTLELDSEIRHEHINGEIFTMAGASEAHNLIVVNVSASLHNQLRGRTCKTYASDMPVRVDETGLYAYPDISIICEDAQFAENIFTTLLNPTVIIEVLTPSTEAKDRGVKSQDYRRIPSLRELVLIAQGKPHVERYFRQDNDTWVLSDTIGLDSRLDLASIDCTLALADVYEQVDFEANEND